MHCGDLNGKEVQNRAGHVCEHGLPRGSVVENPLTNAGDKSSIPWSGRPLEDEMARYSSILAWEIPWREEPGRLQFTELQRVRHDLPTEHMCEKWNISCHISKQRMSHSPSTAATTDGELVNPEGTQEGKNTCHLTAIRLQPLPTLNPEKTQDMKTEDTGPR